ncbi:MAG TPA: cobyrinate a,c-diamide synthase [Nitrospirota bacterium]
MPRIVISAIRGGLGKTTLSLGIVSAWRRQGRRISVFKKGPDFIDAGWLGTAAGRPCYNLDPFMMPQDGILRSFSEHTADSDAAVIEGNRGLYDGVDSDGTYSTARLAKLLKAPVVLIVDCTKTSGTVGAVVLGCRQYDPEVDLRGIILNNVSPGRHESVIRKAVEQNSGVRVVGAVPRQRSGEFPERHMGLTPFHEHPEVEQALEASRSMAERYLDLPSLWDIASSAPDFNGVETGGADSRNDGRAGQPCIGVIRDTAFQFYYPDNLEALEREGARIREINALKDTELPPGIDALYIGGGFPETQAAELAGNAGFSTSVRQAVENGLPVYAECGGLIYLGRSVTVGGQQYPMTGALPVDFILEKKPQAHGYVVAQAGDDSTFLDSGVIIKGHEFHYSRVSEPGALSVMAYRVTRGAGIDGARDGLVYKNVVAAYTHLHAVATPEWAPAMVRKARDYRMKLRQPGGGESRC